MSFFGLKRKKMEPEGRAEDAKNKKRNLFSHGKDRKAAVTASLVTVL